MPGLSWGEGLERVPGFTVEISPAGHLGHQPYA